ncbi:MAG: CHAD domain-containing protein [Gammaproteobacteria bacterium]|nr:CHAD domain-containing protein [Gammaproteobacteria bacterium]
MHDFRVGIKRLTALYYFLNEIDNNLNARGLLKPYRPLFKSLGNIRDSHIAVHLIQDLDQLNPQHSAIMIKALNSKLGRDYRQFQKYSQTENRLSIRMPTIRATGISERTILRYKPVVLTNLLQQILSTPQKMNDTRWHKKRILLKRYHHKLDAFCFCPGHVSDERELKHITMLEQLLGDWHDRVITAELLQSLPELETTSRATIATMKQQDRLLLGSAKIYLRKYAIWHSGR